MAKLPNFVIIGAGKSASTWLQLVLREHPSIFMPRHETPFFEDPHYDENDLSALVNQLDGAPSSAKIGIKRPNYLCTPECALRLAKHLPNAQLIAILRNPVDRAISQYYHLIRAGRVPVVHPDEMFSRMLTGELDSSFVRKMVLDFGLYAQGISNYKKVFPDAQMLILTDLEMRQSPLEVFKRACQYLGVADDVMPAGISRPRNQGIYFSPFLTLVHRLNHLGRSFEAETGLETLRQDVVGKTARWLASMGSRMSTATRLFVHDQKPPVSDLVRARLLEFYIRDIRCLEDLTHMDLRAWKSQAKFLSGVPDDPQVAVQGTNCPGAQGGHVPKST